MKTNKHINAILPVALALASAANSASAQNTAIGFTTNFMPAESTASFDLADADTGVYDESASWVLGWSFAVNAPLSVTKLGYFADSTYYDPSNPQYADVDAAANGTQTYAQSHDVGLYTADGVLLMPAAVAQSGPLAGDYFRYADPTLAAGATSFTLTPGATYVIAGVTGADDPHLANVIQPNGASALAIDPAVSYGEGFYESGATLDAFPTQTDPASGPSYFGPDFQFTPIAPAPEPSSLALFALAVPFIVWRACRRCPASC